MRTFSIEAVIAEKEVRHLYKRLRLEEGLFVRIVSSEPIGRHVLCEWWVYQPDQNPSFKIRLMHTNPFDIEAMLCWRNEEQEQVLAQITVPPSKRIRTYTNYVDTP